MMDHRLALGLLTALLIVAGAPLAYAWARLLPEETEPFQPQPQREGEPAVSPNWRRRRGDALAIFLLALLTTSYFLKFPGMPVGRGLELLGRVIAQPYMSWLVLAARWFFVVVPGLAAVYSAFRPNLFRISLMIGGVLVTGLWLASPYLVAAIQR